MARTLSECGQVVALDGPPSAERMFDDCYELVRARRFEYSENPPSVVECMASHKTVREMQRIFGEYFLPMAWSSVTIDPGYGFPAGYTSVHSPFGCFEIRLIPHNGVPNEIMLFLDMRDLWTTHRPFVESPDLHLIYDIGGLVKPEDHQSRAPACGRPRDSATSADSWPSGAPPAAFGASDRPCCP